jgi:hypothetical protein
MNQQRAIAMADVVDRRVHPTRLGCLVPDATSPVIEVDVRTEPVRADERTGLGTCRPERVQVISQRRGDLDGSPRAGLRKPPYRIRSPGAGRAASASPRSPSQSRPAQRSRPRDHHRQLPDTATRVRGQRAVTHRAGGGGTRTPDTRIMIRRRRFVRSRYMGNFGRSANLLIGVQLGTLDQIRSASAACARRP